MKIKEINKDEFDNFANNHILKNYYQTSTYGEFMKKFGYTPIYIGAYENEEIVGAALILSKYITINVKYGYSPRGFLIDYQDEKQLESFTKAIKRYFSRKRFAFIKINPEITLSEVIPETNSKNINYNAVALINKLESLNYKKLRDNIYFESLLPKYNPIVKLKNFDIEKLNKNIRSKIKNKNKNGIRLIKGDEYNINQFYELVKLKKDNSVEYYKNYYKSFNSLDMADLWLVEINYHEYLEFTQNEWYTLNNENEQINKEFMKNPTNKQLLKQKMESDKKLTNLNRDLSEINNFINNGITKQLLASAFIIKFHNRVNVVISGFDKNNRLNANHLLYTMIIEHYKKEGYQYFDLNGITGDFSKDNPYRGLNEFKLNFDPSVYEYIGEFDLIINQTVYSLLWTTKLLHTEFERKDILKTN